MAPETKKEDALKKFVERTSKHHKVIIMDADEVTDKIQDELVILHPDPDGETMQTVQYHISSMSSHVGKDGKERIAFLLTKSF